MSKVLILGGYGYFGKRIAHLLTRHNVPVIIAGRDAEKVGILARTLPAGLAETAVFDARQTLSAQLKALSPTVVINTCGPFQTSDYAVAETCIKHGTHYIDLADARDFVTNIRTLDGRAKGNNVAVISGASTVPGLTSAVIEHLRPQFSAIDSLDFGIAPGQKAERGLATTQAILGYVGRKLKPCAGYETRYGWQSASAKISGNRQSPDGEL
jgi:saccharopine dehydrogenase-like NADP-dependent oxidoreductase